MTAKVKLERFDGIWYYVAEVNGRQVMGSTPLLTEVFDAIQEAVTIDI
jgi:hypothetical protein